MVEYVDIVADLAFGDSGKGKITSYLASKYSYDIVARWAGGNNAGHTVYVDGEKYATHLVPSGVFHGITSLIGPGCVLHPESFYQELDYLSAAGFDAHNLVKVAPNCHIVTEDHIEYDKRNLAAKLGTTSKGIAPAYASKAARTGILASQVLDSKYLFQGRPSGRILCEGAQGIWLDINQGNYPYVTSSETLPYAACSLGFPTQKIRNIWGCAKAYDTRSGEDPLFPNELLDVPEFKRIGELGEEYGTTTGRRRKVNWLNLDRLIEAINMTGSTHVVINKCDILEQFGEFKLYHNGNLLSFKNIQNFNVHIERNVVAACDLVIKMNFSSSPADL